MSITDNFIFFNLKNIKLHDKFSINWIIKNINPFGDFLIPLLPIKIIKLITKERYNNAQTIPKYLLGGVSGDFFKLLYQSSLNVLLKDFGLEITL